MTTKWSALVVAVLGLALTSGAAEAQTKLKWALCRPELPADRDHLLSLRLPRRKPPHSLHQERCVQGTRQGLHGQDRTSDFGGDLLWCTPHILEQADQNLRRSERTEDESP